MARQCKNDLESLKQNNVLPVLSLRTVDPSRSPTWASRLNPPRSEGDWNEWWEHVFATVYWLNVRNDYQVDNFEISNEPNNPQQGWRGNQQDYFKLLQVASDAIAHVYTTYLPERTFHIHAPKTSGGSNWPKTALAEVPNYFDSVNVHTYNSDVSLYIKRVRNWMNQSALANALLWLGEWGTYTKGYNNLDFSLNLIQNLIRMSQPGESYVYGSHLFSLYDWGQSNGFEGLINAQGDRTLSYYAFRMAIRALQGGRDVLQITTSDPNLTALATQSDSSTIFLLLVNTEAGDRTIEANIPVLDPQAEVTSWEFSQTKLDTITQDTNVNGSLLSFQMAANSSRLIRVSR